MRAIWALTALALTAGLLLVGCKLVDQTTFAPSPEATATKPGPSAGDTRTALLTIDYAAPTGYQDLLRYAVREAETRAPGVQYDVIALLPAGGDAAAAQQHAAEVMRDIMAQGVPADRVHLGLRTAQKGGPQEIRVYVR
jgi:hypothetical protein